MTIAFSSVGSCICNSHFKLSYAARGRNVRFSESIAPTKGERAQNGKRVSEGQSLVCSKIRALRPESFTHTMFPYFDGVPSTVDCTYWCRILPSLPPLTWAPLSAISNEMVFSFSVTASGKRYPAHAYYLALRATTHAVSDIIIFIVG